MPALAAQRIVQPPVLRREPIVCPTCSTTYQVDPNSLGRGRRVRCRMCGSEWFDVSISRGDGQRASNPVLGIDFPHKLKMYLNGLPDKVKQNSARLTHAIKSFLMRNGLASGAVGYTNGIRVDLQHFRNTEFMWDAVAKVPSVEYPGEDYDLLFVAESENQIHIDKILEDANKLPIVRADIRMMFFRANEADQLELFFDKLHGLFHRHRKTVTGDVYLLAGMDMQSRRCRVRRLTIRPDRSNLNPWEEF